MGALFPPNKQKWERVGPVHDTDPTEQLSVINLSSHSLTQAETQILPGSLTFCPQENFDLFEVVMDLQLFVRKLLLKCMYTKNKAVIDNTDWSSYSMREFKALRDITILFEENNTVDLTDQIDLDALLEEQIHAKVYYHV